MSKKYGFLMFFSIIFEVVLLGLTALPFLNLFRPAGNIINDTFISNLTNKVLIDKLGDPAFILAIVGIFVVGIYVKSYISAWNAAPIKSAITFVVFAIIATAVIGFQIASFKMSPEPTVSKMAVTGTRIDSEFDINNFTSLFLGSKTEKRRARSEGVFTEVPKLCFDQVDAAVSHQTQALARPGDEYYVIVINGEGYAYPVDEYSVI